MQPNLIQTRFSLSMPASKWPVFRPLLLLCLLLGTCRAVTFTIVGDQLFTPGFVVIDSPLPGTPVGGVNLELALDITGDGKLPLPPYPSDYESMIYNITVYAYSYVTGHNFTITNATATGNGATVGNILFQETNSSVKHVDWLYPKCLVGVKSVKSVDRGAYNISIHQNFKLNNDNFYTVLDFPISITNTIPTDPNRPACAAVSNPLIKPNRFENPIGVLYWPQMKVHLEPAPNITSIDPNMNGTDLNITIIDPTITCSISDGNHPLSSSFTCTSYSTYTPISLFPSSTYSQFTASSMFINASYPPSSTVHITQPGSSLPITSSTPPTPSAGTPVGNSSLNSNLGVNKPGAIPDDGLGGTTSLKKSRLSPTIMLAGLAVVFFQL